MQRLVNLYGHRARDGLPGAVYGLGLVKRDLKLLEFPHLSLSLERSHAFAHLCAPQNNVFFFFVSSSWLLNSACDQVAHESCPQSRFGPNYFSFAMKKYPPLNLVLADTFIALGNFPLAVFVIVFKCRNNSKNMAGRDISITFKKMSLAHSAWL